MPENKWRIRAKEFVNCNCAYGCPCQFNALPTHGHCRALFAMEITEGYHGSTRLDGLRVAAAFGWPGAIHHGKGEAFLVLDKRATPQQAESLLRILSGQDTEPGATIWNVFAATLDKVYDPVFEQIDFDMDVASRRAHLRVPGLLESRGEPIRNPVTGLEHRARIQLPEGFEYAVAEIGRGWSKSTGPVALELADSHGQFAELHICDTGVIR